MTFDSDCIISAGSIKGFGEIHTWQSSNQSGKMVPFHRESKGYDIYCVEISPRGQYIAAGFQNGLIRIWPLGNRDSAANVQTPLEIYHSHLPVTALTFLTDDLLISGDFNGTICIISIPEVKHIQKIKAHQGLICHLLSLGSHVIASLGIDGQLKIWDMDSLHLRIPRIWIHVSKGIAYLYYHTLTFSEATGYLCCHHQTENCIYLISNLFVRTKRLLPIKADSTQQLHAVAIW